MKLLRITVAVIAVLAVALAFAGCKKKEGKTTAGTAGTAAKTAEVSVTCPKPGENLICQDCKTLFMTDQEYADHMEKQHPDKWKAMKDKFWEMRKGAPPAGTGTK